MLVGSYDVSGARPETDGRAPGPAPTKGERVTEASPAAGASPFTDGLRVQLQAAVLGQEPAVEAVVRAVSIAQARLMPTDRPLANLLFVGPTGVGKTETVKALARTIRGGEDDFCRVDMSSMAQEHYAAAISGAPPGYAGSKEGLSVLDRDKIESNPGTPGIVLFDEIEKAHSSVVRSLLHILDNGYLRLANGKDVISFRNCIVVMTSNLGVAEVTRNRNSWLSRATRRGAETAATLELSRPRLADGRDRATARHALWMNRRDERVFHRALEDFFDPEFLNRIDEIVRFDGIRRETARSILDRDLDTLRGTLKHRHIVLTIDEAVTEHLLSIGFSHVYGARALERVLRQELLAPLSAHLHDCAASSTSPARLLLKLQGDRIVCRRVAATA